MRNPLKNINKPRLYLALYVRGGGRPGDTVSAKYHSALLLIPKGTSLNSTSIQYHVKNTIVNSDGSNPWVFAVESSASRPVRLFAMMLLGKLSVPKDELREELSRLPVVQDDPEWRCRHWVYAAITRLAEIGMLQRLPYNAETLYEAVTRFANEYTYDFDAPVPTCTMAGEKTKSGLHALRWDPTRKKRASYIASTTNQDKVTT
ncbi:hypothetical protein FA95DRAFT_1683958 [Auriscalpium vulgare]|uniref:Uncharacterized protein n=1 Tax=Auriscalpium vulgare TaxID=40419 RepID=A0ACB8R7M5_9AGAM|nr:hypothetical protein FA95DRAFT_1683958 [Auriscalpium vulgare]